MMDLCFEYVRLILANFSSALYKKGPYPCKEVNTNELNKNFIIENFKTFFHK